MHERYNKRINQRCEKRNLNLKSSALVISQVLRKEGIQTEREGKKGENEEVGQRTGGCGWVGDVGTGSDHTHPRPPSAAASSSPDLVLLLVLQNGL